MSDHGMTSGRKGALGMLASQRPRNVSWFGAAGLLFGDWGTSRLYVLGLAFLVAGRTSFYLILGMSLLILAVAWAYTQICRIYPDGGGVYTAAKKQARILGVIGALLLFADYTVTASLSAVEAFHYFGVPTAAEHAKEEAINSRNLSNAAAADAPPVADALSNPNLASESSSENIDRVSNDIRLPATDAQATSDHSQLFTWPPSPGLCAILAIGVIGAFNLMGPKHTAGFAIFAAVGMMAITLLVVAFALPQIQWSQLDLKLPKNESPFEWWHAFVFIVLALSGVEAIANLTGVMKKPVYTTARKSIWLVAAEVALLNLLLAIAMIWLAQPGISALTRESHKEDMLAFMAQQFIGPWGETPVRIIGGLLLLSATNTAVNGLMSIVYVMSRDGEMPAIFQKLNGFGAPWVAAIVAAVVPAIILLFAHDLETLAALYAIGVVGAVALNTLLISKHPRLRKPWRKICMFALSIILMLIWVTLAYSKHQALIFVCVVMATGLILRALTQLHARRRPKLSLLRQAIVEQLTPEAMLMPKMLLATAGSATNAEVAIQQAQAAHSALVVSFVREVALNYKVESESMMTLDTDPAAQIMFTDFLSKGHEYGVPIIPAYDSGTNSPELIAELAAINGVSRVLIGSSRRGALHQIIKGSFQRKLESLLPPEIPVQVLAPPAHVNEHPVEDPEPASSDQS